MTKLTEHNGSKELLVEISFRTMRTIHLPEVSFYTFYGSVTDNRLCVIEICRTTDYHFFKSYT